MFNSSFMLKTGLLLQLVILTACGGSSSGSDRPPPTGNDDVVIEFQFDDTDHGWEAGFADYPVGEEDFYELASEFSQLPSPLEDTFGFNLTGNNHSDDLTMFIKKRFSGFEPNTRYQIQFEITIASNAPSGCVGAGGAPGESVYLKAGLTAIEPEPIDNGSGFYLMNIDKGNQSVSGSDAINIGDFANSKDCEDGDFSYELKTLDNTENAFEVLTESDGSLWAIFATDSGFEGTTSIYYVSGRIVANEL